MTDDEFDSMMETGLAQAKANRSLDSGEVFSKLRARGNQ